MQHSDTEHLLWIEDLLEAEDRYLVSMLSKVQTGARICRVCHLTHAADVDSCSFCGSPDSLESMATLNGLLPPR